MAVHVWHASSHDLCKQCIGKFENMPFCWKDTFADLMVNLFLVSHFTSQGY